MDSSGSQEEHESDTQRARIGFNKYADMMAQTTMQYYSQSYPLLANILRKTLLIPRFDGKYEDVELQSIVGFLY